MAYSPPLVQYGNRLPHGSLTHTAPTEAGQHKPSTSSALCYARAAVSAALQDRRQSRSTSVSNCRGPGPGFPSLVNPPGLPPTHKRHAVHREVASVVRPVPTGRLPLLRPGVGSGSCAGERSGLVGRKTRRRTLGQRLDSLLGAGRPHLSHWSRSCSLLTRCRSPPAGPMSGAAGPGLGAEQPAKLAAAAAAAAAARDTGSSAVSPTVLTGGSF